ncbi:MAG: AAA family ATPase [Gemmataceae bacterium]
MERNASPTAQPSYQLLSLTDLNAEEATCDWLWQGYLAPGSITLLTSPWKSGKTTLISALLTHLGTGGVLAGLPVRPAKAVIVSEESIAQWRLRKQKFRFGPHISWLCRPFRGQPSLEAWQDLIAHFLDYRQEQGIDVVVIDPLASFLPLRSEANATGMLQALLPLQPLTQAGLAVLLLHHPRKNRSADGEWSRGSGALPAHVDIILEMSYYTRAIDADRRRKLTAWSRFDETPRCRVIELTADGTDFLSRGDVAEVAFADNMAILLAILDDATAKMTRGEIRDNWPPELPKPADNTLWRWLDRAVSQGLVCRAGTGHRHDPFRYWNASLEAIWRADPMLRFQAQEAELYRQLGLK